MKKGGKFVEDLSKMMDMGFSLFFKKTNKQLLIHLAVLGLSCGTQDLVP